MTLRHMKIFVAVCEKQSVTAAAEKLFLAQPTVSLAIRELEEYYGIKLFDRISRKLYLTEPGKQFLNYATHIVSLYEEMEKVIKNGDSFGSIRIGASITIGTQLLPCYVSEFYKLYPDVKVHAIVDNSAEIEKRVMENEIDFAIIEGIVHNPQIKFERLMEDELILICGKTHELYEIKEIEPDKLKDYDFILREKGSGTRELFDSTMLSHDIVIKPVWECISTQSILKAVSAGLGLSVMSKRLACSDIEAGSIKRVNIKNVNFKRHFYIIHHKNKYLTDSAKEFMRLCREIKI